jgi:amino acid transporter
MSGEVFLGLLFAVTVFLGFESTAIFRDEVKNPEKTIPRATYLTVVLIGIFCAFCAWMIITAFGSKDMVRVAQEDTAGLYSIAVAHYIGHVGTSYICICSRAFCNEYYCSLLFQL